MEDLRPVGYVIGLLVLALGLTMLAPLLSDIVSGNGEWPVFAGAATVTALSGGLVALSCRNGVGEGLSIRQTFLVTTTIWVVTPVFGAIPFMTGASQLPFVDAFFEAMSGLTTTGATVIEDIDPLPEGLKLWRGIMQWLGGIGIIVVAMVFLPELRVGGMQIFRSEAFDTMGKILPRAGEIASRISVIYVGLTLACAFAYGLAGQSGFDAMVHAMTTVATGGFANYNTSFGDLGAASQYIAAAFMVLAALPFVRYVQLLDGQPKPLLRDPQVRGFFLTLGLIVLAMTVWLWIRAGDLSEIGFRRALFNVTSIMTGTGYASSNYMAWGSFAVVMFFFIGLIGGCAGSTACSVKIFRYQLLFAAINAQVRRIHSTSGVFIPRYDGRPVGDDVLTSVMAFFIAFIAALIVVSIALGMTGLDFITSVSGAATALANVGPGLGQMIGPAGTFAGVGDTAKWILSFAMLLGRLEILVVMTIVTPAFWRA